MPRLTFPFRLDGLLLPVLLGPPPEGMAAALTDAAGEPVLRPARGMIDTGTTVTAVSPGVLSRLSVTPGAAATTTTAAGPVEVRFYRISFVIYDPAGGPSLHQAEWSATSLPRDLDGVDVLFGMDLLQKVVLLVDGPRLTFSLDF